MITLVWQRRQVADSRNEDKASSDHEYVVCYKQPKARLKGNPIDQRNNMQTLTMTLAALGLATI